jgi:hypothetical protein
MASSVTSRQRIKFLSSHHLLQNVILVLVGVRVLVSSGVNGFTSLATLVPQHVAMPLRAHYQFNGGYDASKAGISWNPMQAAEFVIWHSGSAEAAGRQLQPLIQHWTGTDVGEFLTRLYLGEADRVESKLTFESRNVRTPQWKGLEEDGRTALRELLQVCLPSKVLEAAEIARFAEAFLLKEHTWPASAVGDKDANKAKLEKDSFATLGHTAAIAKLIGELRLEKHGEFTADDVLEMVLLPELDVQDSKLVKMHDFFFHVGIRLTPNEKIDIVQGMAKGGWSPANIAKFVSNIEEIPEHEKRVTKSASPTPLTSFAPFPSKQTTSPVSLTTSDSSNVTENTQQSVPFYFGATQEYFSAATSSSNGITNGYKQTP